MVPIDEWLLFTDEITKIARMDSAVLNDSGEVLAKSTGIDADTLKQGKAFAQTPSRQLHIKDTAYFKISEDMALEYIFILKGSDETLLLVGQMAVSQIKRMLRSYGQIISREALIQRLIYAPADNMLLRAADSLHISRMSQWWVYLLEDCPDSAYEDIQEIVRQFAAESQGVLLSIGGGQMAFLCPPESEKTARKFAGEIADTIETESMSRIYIAIGRKAVGLDDIHRAWQSAVEAKTVGKIFRKQLRVVDYHELDVERLIHQIPESAGKIFLNELLGETVPESFQKESFNLLQSFLDNDLSIADTARALSLHRNTLVYRLEKMQKETGLDIRKFKDALKICLASMLVNRLE